MGTALPTVEVGPDVNVTLVTTAAHLLLQAPMFVKVRPCYVMNVNTATTDGKPYSDYFMVDFLRD